MESKGYPELYHFKPERYMVMDFTRGKTLFEIDGRNNLLLKDYDHHLERIFTETRSRGLVPQDVHLNNRILDHSGKLYIVDVGKYLYGEEQRSYRTKWFWTSSSSSFGCWVIRQVVHPGVGMLLPVPGAGAIPQATSNVAK